MKKNRLFFMFAALFVAAAVMFSCQKEEVLNLEEGLMLKSTCITDMPVHPVLDNCETECLQDGPYKQGANSWLRQRAEVRNSETGPNVLYTYIDAVKTQVPTTTTYYRNNLYFTSQAWNTEDEFKVEINSKYYSFDRDKVTEGSGKDKVDWWLLTGPACSDFPFAKVEILIDGITEPFIFDMDDEATTEVYEQVSSYLAIIDLEEIFETGWEKCDEINYTVNVYFGEIEEEEFNPEAIKLWLGIDTDEDMYPYTYTMFAECIECETALTGQTWCGVFGDEDQYNRKAVYAFSTETGGKYKIQGGLTNFTTAYAYETSDSEGTISAKVPGESSNLVVTAEGELELDECGVVEVTVYWHSTNSDTEITGDWSVELDGEKILVIDELECDDTKEGYPYVAPAPIE